MLTLKDCLALADLSEDDADYLDALRSDLEAKAEELGGSELMAWLEENASLEKTVEGYLNALAVIPSVGGGTGGGGGG